MDVVCAVDAASLARVVVQADRAVVVEVRHRARLKEAARDSPGVLTTRQTVGAVELRCANSQQLRRLQRHLSASDRDRVSYGRRAVYEWTGDVRCERPLSYRFVVKLCSLPGLEGPKH